MSLRTPTNEQRERALARAKKENIHIFYDPHNGGMYYTTSRSTKEVYGLRIYENGEVDCSCPGYGYYGCCKHAAALEARLQREQSRSHQG